MKIFYRVLSSNVAGGQRVMLDILREAVRRGHQAVVSAPAEGRLTPMLKNAGAGVHFLSLQKTFYFHQAAALAGYLKKNRFDLVHSHDMVAGNVLTRAAAAAGGIPCISHIHIDNAFNPNPVIKTFQTALDDWSSRLCRKIIAVCGYTKESLLRQGIPSGKIEVVPNGIEAPAPPPSKGKPEILKNLDLPPEAVIFGCVGRLCPVKGQKDLLRAAARFSGQKHVFFVFVGEDLERGGAYEKELREHAREFGIADQTRFAGYREDVNSFMHAFDCVVLPSHSEGLPLVLLEAMAAGKPVIGTRTAGTPELVKNGETGFLADPGNIPQLEKALGQILENRSHSEEMGKRALEHVKSNFSKTRMLERILQIYGEMVPAADGSRKITPAHVANRN